MLSSRQFFSSSGHFVYSSDLCACVNVCLHASVARHTTDSYCVHLSHTYYSSTAGQQLSSLRSANHHSAFKICSNGKGLFQAFFLFQALKKIFLRKILSSFFSSKRRVFKVSKYPPLFSFFFFDFLLCSHSLPFCLPLHSLFYLLPDNLGGVGYFFVCVRSTSNFQYF